jgi:hypothetical protein
VNVSDIKVLDIAATPFRWGAAIRDRRLFHPIGVLAHGAFERVAPPEFGLPMQSAPAIGRVSKALGVPGGLPDIAGLAFRLPAGSSASAPWDLLLASAGAHLVTRLALRPVRTWSSAWLSSLMPFEYGGDIWWVRARIDATVGGGLDLSAVTDQVNRGGLGIDVEQAHGAKDFQPLGRLTLRQVIPTDDPADDVSFDPVLHCAEGISLRPGWLADFRRRAYHRSRQGRDAR